MSIEAMKQALEALDSDDPSIQLRAAVALRQAIEQAEKQEGWVLREVYFSEGESISHREPQPVAWANKKGQFKVHKEANEIFKSTAIPFYAAPVHARPVVHAVRCTYPQCQATNGCVGACSKTAPVHASDIPAERVDETAKDRHEPESNNVEIAAEQSDNYAAFLAGVRFARVNLPAPSKEWVGLTDEAVWLEYQQLWPFHAAEEPTLAKDIAKFARAIEAKLKEKNGG